MSRQNLSGFAGLSTTLSYWQYFCSENSATASLFIFNSKMFKFTLKILLFISPLLFFLAVIEYKARSMPNDFDSRKKGIERNISRAEIIVAGPSHAYYGIKPALLEKPAISVAYPAQDLYYDTRILLKYLPQASNVKLVIITVSYISFEYLMEDSVFNSRANFYYKTWGIPRQNRLPKLADYSAGLLFGFQQSRDFLVTGSIPNAIKTDEVGGDSELQISNESNVKNSQVTINLHNSTMQAKYFDQNIKYLDELLNSLKGKNIQAVIITLPCYSTYYNNVNTDKYLRMQNEIKILSSRYDLKYHNYFKDDRFDTEDFFDSDHLSTKGGEKFTGIINNEVLPKYFPAS
jgi:hypothetical protein